MNRGVYMEKKNPMSEKRLNIDEMAKILTNIGDSYHKTKTPDSQNFCEFKRLFQEQRFETLKKLQPLRRTHPRVTPPEVARKIIEISLEHPGWGCIRISEKLKMDGIKISPPTVQSIMNNHQIGKRHDRARYLEEKVYQDKITLTPEQLRIVEKINPCFKDRERINTSKFPGELLVQDVFCLTLLKGIGKVFVQVVIDMYGGITFCRLDLRKLADSAVMLLHNEVIPFYQQHDLKIYSIMTDNGREFSGKEKHHYELFLLLNDIEHHKLPLRQGQNNGYLLRFRKAVKNEFCPKYLQTRKYENLESLDRDFRQWLKWYNEENPLVGYPNLGVPPLEILNRFLQSQRATNYREF